MAVLSIPSKVLRSATAGRRPNDGTFRALTDGELFLNTQDRVVCYLDATGTLVTMPFDPGVLAALAPLASPLLTGSPKAPTPAATDNSTSIETTGFSALYGVRNDLAQGLSAAKQAQARQNIGAAPVGGDACCTLTLSGGSLKLVPTNGNTVLVAGAPVTIPDAGLTLAVTGLAATTLFYVYLTAAGALEASTTAPVTQAGTGLRIKGPSGSPDATRRLVGMAYTGSGPNFSDSRQYRWTRTWFNDPGIDFLVNMGASNVAGASATPYVLAQGSVLMWAGERILLSVSAIADSAAGNGTASLRAWFNGASCGGVARGQSYSASADIPLATAGVSEAPSDGIFSLGLNGAGDGTNVATWVANYGVAAALTAGSGS